MGIGRRIASGSTLDQIAVAPSSQEALPEVLVIVGTRPEAIKIAPMVLAARRVRASPRFEIAVTRQHGDVVAEALRAFGLRARYELDCVRPTGRLPELLAALVANIGELLNVGHRAAVVVQGDTSSALAGALAAFYEEVPVVHLEAGLLTSTVAVPFPEEAHRRLISDIARLHLAPTAGAAANLIARGVNAADVVITGNTVVDALSHVIQGNDPRLGHELVALAAADQRLIVVTAHRRESWGPPMEQIARALVTLTELHPDVQIVMVRHPNPHVSSMMSRHLISSDRIMCIDPLPYPEFARLLAMASLVLTDSGGLQEELPSLGVRAVVLRDETERPEAMMAGLATLAGTDYDRIVELASAALSSDPPELSGVNPYGDGEAGRRVVEAIAWMLGRGVRPDDYRPPTLPAGSVADTPLHQVLISPPMTPS